MRLHAPSKRFALLLGEALALFLTSSNIFTILHTSSGYLQDSCCPPEPVVGANVGIADGSEVGFFDGSEVGFFDGSEVGFFDGSEVGE